MADFTDRVKLVFEAVTGDATGQVGKLKQGVEESHGAFSKLKTVAGGAIDTIASSPAAMLGVGVAVGKVAFDLVTGFEDAALSAQDFATASGLSVEQASRWQEVAGDLGVSTDTLEGAVNKLNIAASKGALTELGIGGADTNEKLLNALTHLKGIGDATERAKQGAQLFGKSWASLAPLVEESGDLAANLAAVSDAKVIDEGEVRKAREMRDAMDKLGDEIDDIKLKAGEALIGPFTDVATLIGRAVDGANALSDATSGIADIGKMAGGFINPIGNIADGLERASDSSLSFGERAKGLGSALTSNIPVLGGFANSLFGASDAADNEKAAEEARAGALQVAAQASKDAAAAADEQEAALGKLTSATLAQFSSNLALADAADRTIDAFAKSTAATDTATAANYGNKDANDAAEAAMRDAEQAALGQAAAAAKLASDQAVAQGSTLSAAAAATIQANELRTLAGTLGPNDPLRSRLLAYASQIEAIPKTAETTITANTKSAAQQVQELTDSIYRIAGQIFSFTFHANNTATSAAAAAAPSSAMVTAAAPSSRGLSVVPSALGAAPRALGPASGGAPIINLNVSVAPFANPAEVGRTIADYLDAFYRRSGSRRWAVA